MKKERKEWLKARMLFNDEIKWEKSSSEKSFEIEPSSLVKNCAFLKNTLALRQRYRQEKRSDFSNGRQFEHY